MKIFEQKDNISHDKNFGLFKLVFLNLSFCTYQHMISFLYVSIMEHENFCLFCIKYISYDKNFGLFKLVFLNLSFCTYQHMISFLYVSIMEHENFCLFCIKYISY